MDTVCYRLHGWIVGQRSFVDHRFHTTNASTVSEICLLRQPHRLRPFAPEIPRGMNITSIQSPCICHRHWLIFFFFVDRSWRRCIPGLASFSITEPRRKGTATTSRWPPFRPANVPKMRITWCNDYRTFGSFLWTCYRKLIYCIYSIYIYTTCRFV